MPVAIDPGSLFCPGAFDDAKSVLVWTCRFHSAQQRSSPWCWLRNQPDLPSRCIEPNVYIHTTASSLPVFLSFSKWTNNSAKPVYHPAQCTDWEENCVVYRSHCLSSVHPWLPYSFRWPGFISLSMLSHRNQGPRLEHCHPTSPFMGAMSKILT